MELRIWLLRQKRNIFKTNLMPVLYKIVVIARYNTSFRYGNIIY